MIRTHTLIKFLKKTSLIKKQNSSSLFLKGCLITDHNAWSEFIKGFDSSDGYEIYFLEEILSVSNANF